MFQLYIYKVLKQIHPHCSISKKGMNIMCSFMDDIFDRIAAESAKLVRNSKKRTLSTREAETAVKLIIPGELAMHATQEGAKAVMTFNSRGLGKGDVPAPPP